MAGFRCSLPKERARNLPTDRSSVMTNADIRDMFDTNPNMTIAQLARIAGKTTEQIKRILMESK